MSWQAAWASPAYRAYAWIIAGLLVTGAVALLVLGRGMRRDVSKVWVIWRSWLVMAPLGMLVVALGRGASVAGLAALSILGFNEYARATGLYRDRAMTLVVRAAIVATAVAAYAPDPFTGRPGWRGWFDAMPAWAVGAAWAVPIVRNRAVGQLHAVALAALGFLGAGWMFLHLALLANATNAYGYLLFVISAAEVCDIAAYTSGKLLGRRPLRSNISPRKTWGGAIGGLAVAMALPWALAFSFPRAFDWRAKVLAGLIVGVGGQLGDLAVSVLKRDLGIKDLGSAIPGHGGILDRIDSLIFVAPLFAQLVACAEPFG